MSILKTVKEISEDIQKVSGFGSALCDAIAMGLYDTRYRKLPDNIGDFSDGYHTFNELYHHRAVLFSVICNMMPERAWKSKLHDTGDMYDGMFIVGIETEQGQATYHYDIKPYWDMFKVKEVERAPKWDGHTAADAIQRIGNISCKGYRKQNEVIDEFAKKLKDYPIEVRLPLLGLETKEEIEMYVNNLFDQIEDIIDKIAKEMKGE